MGKLNREERIGFLCLGLPYFETRIAQSYLDETLRALEGDFRMVGSRAVITDQSSLESALESLRKEDLSAVLLQIGTFPDGDMLASVVQELKAPFVLHGLPEANPDREIATNSMCGLNMAAFTLKALDHPHTWVLGAPSDPAVGFQLKAHLAAAMALAELRRNRIGLVGFRAPGFYPSTFDELLLRRRLGVAVEHIGLNVYTSLLQTSHRKAAPRKTFPMIEGGSLPEETIARIEQAYGALHTLFERSGLRYFAIKDWPELFDAEVAGGLWPALGWVQPDGYTVAPEGDVNGAITMVLEQTMSRRPAFFADISAVDEKSSSLTLWHYGGPESLARSSEEIRYGREGREVQFTLSPGRATLARVGHYRGDLRILSVCVEVLDVPTTLRRAAAVVRTTRTPAKEVVARMFDGGWDHHVCVGYGDLAEAFRAIGKFSGIPVESL